MTTALGAAQLEGLQAGLLRAERGLRSPGDVRAALADPLLDAELAALLAGMTFADPSTTLGIESDSIHWGVV